MVKYSVVIPVYNESRSVAPLAGKLAGVFRRMGEPFEVIFVDDGSTDGTSDRLRELSSVKDFLRVVNLVTNNGQTAALRAGFEKAGGDIIISMDGDLQNDPDDIPRIVAKLGQGCDFVCGWRRRRKDPLSKKVASWLGNVVQRKVFRSNLHDISCTLRAYKREAIRSLSLKRNGAHRFIPYLLLMTGRRGGEVEVNHLPRPYGRSKYGLSRTFRVLRDFLILLFNRRLWL